MKKTMIVILIIVLFNLIILKCASYSQGNFKDASPELKEVIKEFDKRGVLKEFIKKYGEDYFRPTSTITREDLIMALREYDKIIKGLIEYRKMLSAKVKELSKEVKRLKNISTDPSSSDADEEIVDKVINETQKVIPLLIENAPMSKKLKEELISMREEISMIQKPSVDITNKRIKKIIKEIYPQIEKEAKNQKEIERKISNPQNKLDLFTEQYDKASKNSTGLMDEYTVIKSTQKNSPQLNEEPTKQKKIRKEIAELEKEINKWAKLYQGLQIKEGIIYKATPSDKGIRKKIDKLEKNLERLESRVVSSNKVIQPIITKLGKRESMGKESKKNSMLTKMSLGISLLALLFMVR